MDALVAAVGLPVRVVQIALLELELAGHIVRPGPGLIARRAD
jgi:predicted Rossmann fold nucleotide-binding protein DprA/Smf involved in DNA uptake